MVNKIKIIFCGLIRTPELFKKSILELRGLSMRNLIGEIIFSTWDYEIDKYPGMRNFLEREGVSLVEMKEPGDRGFSNIWCQMLSLEKGLEKTHSNDFVLKTRPDVYIKKEFLLKLFLEKNKLLKIEHNLKKGNIFKNKVWVPWFELKRPFYMADECFFGKSGDLRLLVNYERNFNEEEIGSGVTHIRRFIFPFMKKYPLMKKSLVRYYPENKLRIFLTRFSNKFFDLRRFFLLRKLSESYKKKIFKKHLKDPVYIQNISDYYQILESHFYICGDYSFDQIIFKGYSTQTKALDNYNIDKNFVEENDKYFCGDQTLIYNLELLKNIFKKKIKPTELGKKILSIR